MHSQLLAGPKVSFVSPFVVYWSLTHHFPSIDELNSVPHFANKQWILHWIYATGERSILFRVPSQWHLLGTTASGSGFHSSVLFALFHLFCHSFRHAANGYSQRWAIHLLPIYQTVACCRVQGQLQMRQRLDQVQPMAHPRIMVRVLNNPKCWLKSFTKHPFVIRPEFSNNTWNEYCTKSKFNESEVETLKSELVSNWPNLLRDQNEDSLWAHEWNKHGTCSRFNQFNYFARTLSLHNRYNLDQWLADASILPSNSVKYSVSQFVDAIGKHISSDSVALNCERHHGGHYLKEVYICVAFGDAQTLIPCTVETTCQEDFFYPNLNWNFKVCQWITKRLKFNFTFLISDYSFKIHKTYFRGLYSVHHPHASSFIVNLEPTLIRLVFNHTLGIFNAVIIKLLFILLVVQVVNFTIAANCLIKLYIFFVKWDLL